MWLIGVVALCGKAYLAIYTYSSSFFKTTSINVPPISKALLTTNHPLCSFSLAIATMFAISYMVFKNKIPIFQLSLAILPVVTIATTLILGFLLIYPMMFALTIICDEYSWTVADALAVSATIIFVTIFVLFYQKKAKQSS
jgi:hypothetical protein